MPVFTANVPGVLKIGDRIEIVGKIKENARKMSVNLCAQEGEEPRDVVLHFDVRFHRDNIISLSRKNGVWIGSGNYDTNYNMFVPGTIFRIVFMVKDTDVITIYCQGKFHSNFLPKIPLSMARFLVAWADVERITHCFFHMGTNSPPPPPPPPCVGDDKHPPPAAPSASPHRSSQRANVAAAMQQDYKSYRTRRKSVSSPTSNVSSDEDERKPKAEGRADRFFYDSLMCPSPDRHKFRREPSVSRRGSMSARVRPEHSRKYPTRTDESETENNYSNGYTDETISQDTTTADSESPELNLKRRIRRGSRNAITQVANFMGKSNRKNVL